MSGDASLREHLLTLLEGRIAHVGFDETFENLPPEHRGVRPEGFDHSAWELLEHLRIAQRDILDFSDPEKGEDYEELDWPDDYWPATPEPPDDDAWDRSLAAYREDHEAVREMVRDDSRDLHAPFPWGDGQTLLREVFLVADHASYHLGQVVAVRKALGEWPPTR